MKAMTVLVAAVAALGLPGPALGKGRNTVQVCGPEACTTLEDRAGARYIGSPQEGVFEPPGPSAYYRLYVKVEAGTYRHTHFGIYSPSEGLIGVDEGARRALYWHVPHAETLRELRAATRELGAYEAPPRWPLAVGALSTTEREQRRSLTHLAVAVVLLAFAGGAGIAFQIAVRRPRTA